MGPVMKLIKTWVNDEEWELIQEYCQRKGISVYRLLKDSVFQYIERTRESRRKRD